MITLIPSKEVPVGFIKYHPFDNNGSQMDGYIAIKSLIKEKPNRIANNIVLLKVATDPLFPEFTMPIEINANYSIEYHMGNDCQNPEENPDYMELDFLK